MKGGGFRKSEKKRSGKGTKRIKKSEAQKKHLVDDFPVSERKEEEVKEKGKKRNKSPKAKQFLGRSGRWLFLLLILMQNWFCVDAAAGRWSQQGKRKRLSCRMRWKALS